MLKMIRYILCYKSPTDTSLLCQLTAWSSCLQNGAGANPAGDPLMHYTLYCITNNLRIVVFCRVTNGFHLYSSDCTLYISLRTIAAGLYIVKLCVVCVVWYLLRSQQTHSSLNGQRPVDVWMGARCRRLFGEMVETQETREAGYS